MASKIKSATFKKFMDLAVFQGGEHLSVLNLPDWARKFQIVQQSRHSFSVQNCCKHK